MLNLVLNLIFRISHSYSARYDIIKQGELVVIYIERNKYSASVYPQNGIAIHISDTASCLVFNNLIRFAKLLHKNTSGGQPLNHNAANIHTINSIRLLCRNI